MESTAPLRQGTASTLRQAWVDAIDAALHLLSTAPGGCGIVIGNVPALLVPGKGKDGQVDMKAVRAAAERMANAATGGLS